jgi:hypothetical protein
LREQPKKDCYVVPASGQLEVEVQAGAMQDLIEQAQGCAVDGTEVDRRTAVAKRDAIQAVED